MNNFKELLIRNKKILIFSFILFLIIPSIYLSIVPQKYTATLDIRLGENGGKLVINAEDFADQLKLKTELYDSLLDLFFKRNGRDNADIAISSLSSIKSLPTRKNVEITIISENIETTNKVANDLGISIEEIFQKSYFDYKNENKMNQLGNDDLLKKLLKANISTAAEYNYYYQMIKNINDYSDQNSQFKTFQTKIYSLKLANSSTMPQKIKIYMAAIFLWACFINLMFFLKLLK